MQEPYEEGVATHFGLESCASSRKAAGEALTEGSAGRVLSRERVDIQGADAVLRSGRQHRVSRDSEAHMDPARSETPCTHGHSMRGNREIPSLTGGEMARPVRERNPVGVIGR